MSNPAHQTTTQRTTQTGSDLFMWRGAGIVLLGERVDGRWVLARGWATMDALEHVRRWSFAAPGPFAGQVRRLVAEATGDHVTARDESARALAWTAQVTTAG